MYPIWHCDSYATTNWQRLGVTLTNHSGGVLSFVTEAEMSFMSHCENLQAENMLMCFVFFFSNEFPVMCGRNRFKSFNEHTLTHTSSLPIHVSQRMILKYFSNLLTFCQAPSSGNLVSRTAFWFMALYVSWKPHFFHMKVAVDFLVLAEWIMYCNDLVRPYLGCCHQNKFSTWCDGTNIEISWAQTWGYRYSVKNGLLPASKPDLIDKKCVVQWVRCTGPCIVSLSFSFCLFSFFLFLVNTNNLFVLPQLKMSYNDNKLYYICNVLIGVLINTSDSAIVLQPTEISAFWKNFVSSASSIVNQPSAV